MDVTVATYKSVSATTVFTTTFWNLEGRKHVDTQFGSSETNFDLPFEGIYSSWSNNVTKY